MAIKIGHSSIDENGKAHGGVSGDQTGKEVCIRNWYDGKWHTLLRCNSPEKAEIMARECEKACANNNIGYDQYQRNTLRKEAQKAKYDLSKVGKCECDCSSFMSVLAECAGIEVRYRNNNAPTTRTMEDDFESTNQFTSYHDDIYFESDKYLKRGDILIKDGHTVMVLENGLLTDRKLVSVKLPVLKRNCKGNDVRALQGILTALGYDTKGIDGSFGGNTEAAVKKFQGENNLEVDGSVGNATWSELIKC